VALSKNTGKIDLWLAPGHHRLEWDGHSYEAVLTQDKDKEVIEITVADEEGYFALESFIVHARECSRRKSNLDRDNIVVKVLQGPLWKVASSYPKRQPESLITGDNTVRDILVDMQKFLANEQVYIESGQPFKRNYLLIGPPGSGKSSLITVAASVLNLNIHFISITANMSEKNLCGAISALSEDSLLVIEDIDVLCTAVIGGNQSAAVALASLTNILDGTLHKHKLITILTSANSTALDGILVRHGRIDYTARFSQLTKKQVGLMVAKTFNDHTACSQLATRIWGVIESLQLSSSVLAQFLFAYQDRSPDEIDTELCRKLCNGTHTDHIKEGVRDSGQMWM
jgi:chaperone BCS1